MDSWLPPHCNRRGMVRAIVLRSKRRPCPSVVSLGRCANALSRMNGDAKMLWGLIALLLVFWLIGLTAHVAGSLIHLLLVVALVVLVFNLITGRRTS